MAQRDKVTGHALVQPPAHWGRGRDSNRNRLWQVMVRVGAKRDPGVAMYRKNRLFMESFRIPECSGLEETLNPI